MIAPPKNDEECLEQLTQFARELAPTTLIQTAARSVLELSPLASPTDAVAWWIQSLPQTNDDGHEHVRAIQCDVPQRTRLLPDDPNCVERAMGALMLLEALDPATPRRLATRERPQRHTYLEELRSGEWYEVNLYPHRNFEWGNFGKDLLQGFHQYAGKPLLKFWLGDTGGTIADAIGDQENRLIGRGKRPEKKIQPPPARRPVVATPRPTAPNAPSAGAGGSFLDGLGGGLGGAGAIVNLLKGGPHAETRTGQSADSRTAAGASGLAGWAGAAVDRVGAALARQAETETERPWCDHA